MLASRKWFPAVGLLVVLSMVLGACAQPTATPVTTAAPTEPQPEPTPALPYIPAEGLVACKPIPEIAFSGSGGRAAIASAISDGAGFASYGTFDAGPVEQVAGKVYRVGVFEDVTTMNYWAANGPDNTVWNSYMLPPRLSMYGLSDKFFTFVPILALDLPSPLVQEGDFWVVEIPMRTDVRWSDGQPVTAEDVAFTANTVLEIGLISGNWSSWYDGNFLERVEASDTYTVKYIYHTKPGLARHEWGTLQAPILARHYWAPVVEQAMAPIMALGENPSEEDLTAAQAEAQDILFSHQPEGEPLAGAFVFDKWEKGAFLQNARNADYYHQGVIVREYEGGVYQEEPGKTYYGEPSGAPLIEYRIGPNVEKVVYSIYGSQDAAILALRNGEVDFILNPLGLSRGLAAQVEGDPNLTVVKNSVNGFRYLSFNNRRRPMNDCSFRQAVAVLIDKEFVTNTILQKVAFPLYTFVPEGNAAWYFDDVPKLGQGLTREQRTNLAVAILQQAGYTWEDGKVPAWDADNRMVVPGGRLIMPDGVPVPPLVLLAPSPGYDPLRSTFAIWIETWLNEFGIPLTAELAGFNVIVPKIFTEQNFDMYILGWSLGLFPSYLRDFFSAEQAVLDGNNAGGYVNPEFEELSQAILTCDAFEACKEISDQIQILLATEVPYVLLFDTGMIEAYRSASVEYPYTEQLSGLQYTHQGGGPLQTTVRVK